MAMRVTFNILPRLVEFYCDKNCIEMPCKLYSYGSGDITKGVCQCTVIDSRGTLVTYCKDKSYDILYLPKDLWSWEMRLTLFVFTFSILPLMVWKVYVLMGKPKPVQMTREHEITIA